MKLKRLAGDFQVEEQISLRMGSGPFALYRLTKQSLGTLEAIAAIRRRWNLPKDKLAFAGLKDKHALTAQHVTIHGGQRRGMAQANFELKYLGQVERPIHASDITANRFVVVIRDLAASEIDRMTRSLAAVARDGLPNYFDNQRFGSLGESGEFIAKLWCLGDYERALWLAIAEPNHRDGPAERDEKRVLRDHWGDWPQCAELLRQSACDNIVAYLVGHPRDFRRAIALVPHELRSLWLAAFQSHLWNQVLAAAIGQICRPEQLALQQIGGRRVPFFTELDDAQRQQFAAMLLPLPSARIHLDEGPLKSTYDRVLANEGLELRQVRVKYPRDSFFSKGERTALVHLSELQHQHDADELYLGHQKLALHFTLPRGSYATILVKQIAGGGDAPEDVD
jgi:tRNA pseudouridine13 synthase